MLCGHDGNGLGAGSLGLDDLRLIRVLRVTDVSLLVRRVAVGRRGLDGGGLRRRRLIGRPPSRFGLLVARQSTLNLLLIFGFCAFQLASDELLVDVGRGGGAFSMPRTKITGIVGLALGDVAGCARDGLSIGVIAAPNSLGCSGSDVVDGLHGARCI